MVSQNLAPKWYWKMKLVLFAITVFGIGNISYLYLSSTSIQELHRKYDHYRNLAPTKEELLKESMKLSDVQQQGSPQAETAKK